MRTKVSLCPSVCLSVYIYEYDHTSVLCVSAEYSWVLLINLRLRLLRFLRYYYQQTGIVMLNIDRNNGNRQLKFTEVDISNTYFVRAMWCCL